MFTLAGIKARHLKIIMVMATRTLNKAKLNFNVFTFPPGEAEVNFCFGFYFIYQL